MSDDFKKSALFVDVQNIYYTIRDIYQRRFNYRKFWQSMNTQGEIVVANAYAIDRGDEQQAKFQNALRNIGFTVKLKPFIQRSDGSAKGDWDVGITIDVLEAANKVDTIVLLSGDGDFDILLETVKRKCNVTTHVYGVSSLTANSLINAADHYYPIKEDLLL